MTVQKILQTTETETIQLVEIETIRIADQKNIPTIHPFIIIIIIDTINVLEMETAIIRTYQETFINHRIEIILNFQTQRVKTIEAVHKNIKEKINQKQYTDETNSDSPGIDKLQLNHIDCKTTDDENDTENTLIFTMLKVKNEYETPTELN